MGELKIKLPDDVEKAFRRLAMKRFGYQKGALSEAAQEAFEGWAESEESKITKDDLWDELKGVLKHVKKSSVQLQHESWDYIAKKHSKHKKKLK